MEIECFYNYAFEVLFSRQRTILSTQKIYYFTTNVSAFHTNTLTGNREIQGIL